MLLIHILTQTLSLKTGVFQILVRRQYAYIVLQLQQPFLLSPCISGNNSSTSCITCTNLRVPSPTIDFHSFEKIFNDSMNFLKLFISSPMLSSCAIILLSSPPSSSAFSIFALFSSVASQFFPTHQMYSESSIFSLETNIAFPFLNIKCHFKLYFRQ